MIEHITQEFLDMIKLPNPNGRKLNYLFIMPRYITRNDTIYVFPVGFAMVCASIKASGRNVITLNLNYKDNYVDLIKQTIRENNIDVVAIGGLSSQYNEIKRILDIAKGVNPHIVTLVGGGIITTDPETAIIALDSADYGLIGEGELTINDVAYALENNEPVHLLPNVVTREYGANPIRPEIKNLDVLPFPDYEGLEYHLLFNDGLYGDMDVEPKTIGIATGRSCPFHCTFCFHTSGQTYRRRSVENVEQELEMLIKKYDVKKLYIIDELFVTDTEYIREMIKMISKYHLPYRVTARVDMVSENLLQLLRDTGCYQVSFGVESADDRILKSMRKNITVSQINRAFEMSDKVGIYAQGHIIFGDIEEDSTSIQTSLKWWKEHPNWHIKLWWILTFPGSYLYKVACQRGIISDPVQYLRNEKFQLNISKLSDKEYWTYVNMIELYQILESESVDISFSDIKEIFENSDEKLSNLSKFHTVAVWPATNENIMMLQELSEEFVRSENVFLVNLRPQDPFNNGVYSSYKNIYTPDEIFKTHTIDTVVFAYGHRYSSDIYKNISKMAKQYRPDIQIIKLGNYLAR